MAENPISTAMFALGSAAAWGTGDFSGGLASKRSKPLAVMLVSNPFGLVLLLGFALTRQASAPTLQDSILGVLAGICGGVALFLFYGALANGQMGVVAPVTAVVANVTSMLFGALTEGAPQVIQVLGFTLAILGVWIISKPDAGSKMPVRVKDLLYPILAGFGFGAFFILMGQFSSADTSWAVVLARVGTLFIVVVVLLVGQTRPMLAAQSVVPALIAGFMDSVGNIFFAIATQMGRLDVSAALSSLYPVATVILAMIILRERITPAQRLGAIISLAAIPLIAA